MTVKVPLYGAGQAFTRSEHTVELFLSGANNCAIQKAVLQPADVEVDSIVKLAGAGSQGVSFLVGAHDDSNANDYYYINNNDALQPKFVVDARHV